MSVQLSTVILAQQIGLLGVGDHNEVGYAGENSSLVPTTPEEVYPGEFGNADVFLMQRGTGNPVDPHGGVPGIKFGDLAPRTIPDYDPDGNESGLVNNWPHWYGDAGIGTTPMPGATVRVRRPAESGAGPVGAQDEMATLQYSMYQSVVDMATDEASQASLVMFTQ